MKRADIAEYTNEPSVWSRLMWFTVIGFYVGLLMVVAGCVAFLFTSWVTAVALLATGLVCVVGGVASFQPLNERTETPPQPGRRARKLAARHDLGDHVFTRKSPNPLLSVPAVLLAPLPPLALLAGVGFVANLLGEFTMRAGALFLIVFLGALAAVPLAVLAALLLLPKRLIRVSLFEHGLVHSLYGRTRAHSWGEVASADFGRLGGYRLVLRSGGGLLVPWQRVRSDPCLIHLARALERHGVELTLQLRQEIAKTLEHAPKEKAPAPLTSPPPTGPSLPSPQ